MKHRPTLWIASLVVTGSIVGLAVVFAPTPIHEPPSVQASFIEDALGVGFNILACNVASSYADELKDLTDRVKEELGGALCDAGGNLPVVGPFVQDQCNEESESGDGQPEESDFVPVHVQFDNPFSKEVERQKIELVKTQDANCLKKELLEFVSQNIIKNIVEDSGFITNFRDHLLTAGVQAEYDFLAQLSRAGICPQNRSVIFTLMGGVDAGWASSDNSPESIVRCSLAEVLDLENGGLEAYYDDFRTGGWDAWLSQINPNNTLLGQYTSAKETRDALIAANVRGQEVEAISSDGFNPKKERVCIEEQTIDLGQGLTETYCVRYEENILTPGSLLSDQVERAAGIKLDDVRGADTYYEILYEAITSVGDWLVGKLIDDGLSSFNSTLAPQPAPPGGGGGGTPPPGNTPPPAAPPPTSPPPGGVPPPAPESPPQQPPASPPPGGGSTDPMPPPVILGPAAAPTFFSQNYLVSVQANPGELVQFTLLFQPQSFLFGFSVTDPSLVRNVRAGNNGVAGYQAQQSYRGQCTSSGTVNVVATVNAVRVNEISGQVSPVSTASLTTAVTQSPCN